MHLRAPEKYLENLTKQIHDSERIKVQDQEQNEFKVYCDEDKSTVISINSQ
jgi:hypothetical protein